MALRDHLANGSLFVLCGDVIFEVSLYAVARSRIASEKLRRGELFAAQYLHWMQAHGPHRG